MVEERGKYASSVKDNQMKGTSQKQPQGQAENVAYIA